MELTGKGSDFLEIAVAAAGRGDLDVVGRVLELRPKWISRRGSHGRTMLWEAAWRNRPEMVGYLAERGSPIDSPGCHFKPLLMEVSPLCAASVKGHDPVVEILERLGAEPSLHDAAYLGDHPRVESIVRSAPRRLDQALEQYSPHIGPHGGADSSYATPLCYALCGKQQDVARWLIESGAEVGSHSWHFLRYVRSVDALQLLIDSGVDLAHAEPYEDPRDPIARLLAKHGVLADVDRADDGKWPPLVYICRGDRGGNPEEVKRLLDLGANVEIRNYKGKTALHVAARSGFEPAARLLLEHGANPNATDPAGETPLFDAVRSTIKRVARTAAVIETLLEFGADLEALNRKGLSVQEVAREKRLPNDRVHELFQ